MIKREFREKIKEEYDEMEMEWKTGQNAKHNPNMWKKVLETFISLERKGTEKGKKKENG